jgi:protein-S-isoprenylcysteine O-methyltransferase Ste14
MRKAASVVGSALFLVLAPGTVDGLVPWWIAGWRFHPPLLWIGWGRLLGVALVLAGAPVVLDSFARFALQGLGTPAPVFPTRHLVTTGLFRHVRNPIYVGNVSVVLGQGLLIGDVRVLLYGMALWLGFHLFVLGYEEPSLRQTFGAEYERFCANVPRWLPRVRPWRPENDGRFDNGSRQR